MASLKEFPATSKTIVGLYTDFVNSKSSLVNGVRAKVLCIKTPLDPAKGLC